MKVQKIGVVGLALAAAGAVALAPTAGAVQNEFVGKTDQQLAQAAIERAGVVVGSRVNAVVNAPQEPRGVVEPRRRTHLGSAWRVPGSDRLRRWPTVGVGAGHRTGRTARSRGPGRRHQR